MTNQNYEKLEKIVANYEMSKIEYGINFIFVVSQDYREIISIYIEYTGAEPTDNTIWKNNKGQFEFRLHK